MPTVNEIKAAVLAEHARLCFFLQKFKEGFSEDSLDVSAVMESLRSTDIAYENMINILAQGQDALGLPDVKGYIKQR